MNAAVEFDYDFDRKLPTARILLPETDLIQPVWPGLYAEYPPDPARSPMARFGIHNGVGEALFLWHAITWAVTDGLDRVVCPGWYRDQAAQALGLDRSRVPAVRWEYHVDTYEGPVADADRGFRPAQSSYPLRPANDPWAMAHRYEAALLPVDTLDDVVAVQRCLLGDASSELTLWGMRPGRQAGLIESLSGPRRPRLPELLTDDEVFADVALALDLVGEPRQVLTIRGRSVARQLPPVAQRARAAWAAYLGEVDTIGDFDQFAAALDRLRQRVLGG